MKIVSEARRILAAGAKLVSRLDVLLGQIQVEPDPITASGDGTADYSAPLQFYQQFTGATGVQTVNLGSLVGAGGETVDFAAVREMLVHNLSDDAADTLIVRPAASNGFAGDLSTSGTDAPRLTVQASSVGVYASKPLGTPHDVSTNGTIELDFGAGTFSARLVVKGNA